MFCDWHQVGVHIDISVSDNSVLEFGAKQIFLINNAELNLALKINNKATFFMSLPFQAGQQYFIL